MPPTSPHYLSAFRLFSKAIILGIEFIYLRFPLEQQREQGTLGDGQPQDVVTLLNTLQNLTASAVHQTGGITAFFHAVVYISKPGVSWQYSGTNSTLHHCSSCTPLHFPVSFNLHLPFQRTTSRTFKETPLFLFLHWLLLTTTVTVGDRDCMYIILWSDLMADVFGLEKVLKHKGLPQKQK